MSAMFFIVSAVAGAIGIASLAALAWLWRALKWEVVDDDQLHYRIARGRLPRRGWLKGWIKPKNPLLTYRRDEQGRFRRYRR
jgi:hypothetical protein